MGQRLVRAKARIRDSGLRFELPAAGDLPERLHDVLAAIYAAYGISFDAIPGADPGAPDLAEESIFLARLLATLMPSEPEVKGLLALMLYCEARRPARRAADGRFIPLRSQDPRLWRRDLIIEAENLLTEASRHARYGRFQCEAAIQSVHVQQPLTGQVNHDALIMLYRLLATRSPSVGAQVGLAAALLEAGASADALAELDALPSTDVADYQPYWVTRAAVMRVLGRSADHRSALQTALGLTHDEALRRHLGASQDG
jgi:RNA polymerase sigma-70 factor (ECF subfamily)